MTKRQSGMAVLLTTSMLLTGALILMMTSYRGIFFHIKQAQNEIESSREFWITEGGLECAYSQLRLGYVIEEIVEGCEFTEGLSVEITEIQPDIYQIVSRYSYARSGRIAKAERVSSSAPEWSWLEGSWHDF